MSGTAYSRLTSVTFQAEGLWPLLKSLSPRRSQILLHQGISLLKFNGSDSSISELAINFSALLKRITRVTIALDKSAILTAVCQCSNMSTAATIITELLTLSLFKLFFLSDVAFTVLTMITYILTRQS